MTMFAPVNLRHFRVRSLLVFLGACAISLVGPLSGTAWASAGCTASAGGAAFSYFDNWLGIVVNQPFSAGEQFDITFSTYSNGSGGPPSKHINIGQGDFSGNANSGGFGTFVVSGPGTFGPFTVPAGGITRLSMTIAGGEGTMNATGVITCPPSTTVTGISPTSGTTAGGAAVTITGTSLTGATAVTIGGVAATGITVVNSTTITATTPAHAAGAVNVVVTTPSGTGTGTGIYTYIAAPTVTAITPINGPTAGGTSVTITGTNLTGATAVTIGGGAATGVTVVNPTTITAATPAHAPGAVNVVVTTAGGTGTGIGIYTYVAAPTVTAVNPSSGSIAGGTSATLTGTSFTGATAVTVGGVAATAIVVVNATTITISTPAHASGSVNVVVTTAAGTGTGTGLYTYASGPTVTGISPGSGPIAGATAVTITGSNLTGATAITIGGIAATGVTVVDVATITAIAPAHDAGSVNVVVTTPGGTGTGPGLYTYNASLTLASTASVVTQVGQSYSQTNVAGGGTPGYTYVVSAGTLPAGASFTPSAGLVSGIPTKSGDFSYTITVTDSGATQLTATQVVSGSITAVLTTTSLTSSPNPSLMGQPVTLIATVTPASATGTVAFKDEGKSLCSGVALASGKATCTFAFAATGAHSITAAYDASTALAGSTSSTLVQTVNDQRVKTTEVIGKFVSRRNDLIAANEPDASRQIDRLVEAGGNAGTAATTAGAAPTRNVGPSDDANRIRTSNVRANGGTADRGASALTGPVRIAGSSDGAMRFAFATSLSQMLRYGSKAGQAGGLANARARSAPFDIWVDGKYASFHDNRVANDLDGHFGLVSIGGDYVLSRTFLAGGMVQFDNMRQRSNLKTSEVTGNGWMAGPYATVKLTDKMFWQGRAAWGRSSNNASPFQTYTDEFGTNRWLIASTLTGRWAKGPWVVSPAVSVAYIEDVARSYTDSFSIVIPEVKSRLGQARVGPQLNYRYQFSPRVAIEPRLGLQMISNFAGTTTVKGTGQIDGENAGPVGVRGRAEIGARVIMSNGVGIDVSGSYDGIGATDYPARTGQVMVRVPLP